MNKRACHLMVIPSAIAFFTLLGLGEISSFVIAFFVGSFLGAGEYVYLQRNTARVNKWQLFVSALAGLFVCCLAVRYYCIRIPSDSSMSKLVARVFSDYPQGLLITSTAIGLIAFPFVFTLLKIFLPYIIRSFVIIDYKRLRSEFVGNTTIGSALKKAGVILLNIVSAALVGTLLLAAVYTLPVSQINNNVKASAKTIQAEGTYPQVSGLFTSVLDNLTDSIMMLEAANDTVESPLIDAMNVPRGCIEEKLPDDVLTAHYIDGLEFDRTLTYPRYWHGYLIFLKPLFLVLNYNTVRMINGFVQALLVILTCCLLYKKGFQSAVIPYILSYCMLMPIALAKAFQYSSCFYVFTIGCIGLLLLPKEKRKEKSYLVFLYCGILTAFFDFLTYPIATFGVPMVFWLLLEENDSTESKISCMVKYGLVWCVGFGCMWAAKWIIGSVITGNHVIADGLASVAMRTSNTSEDGAVQYGVLRCELMNYKEFFTTPVTVLALADIVYMMIRSIKGNASAIDRILRVLFPFLLVSLAPVVWYAFATNHSIIHVWFTNKACITSLLAVMFGLTCLLQAQKREQDRSTGYGNQRC